MSAEQSSYQALRAHLAYLRLGAAAEALPPAELERATKDKLGPTAFLERLLSIEVEATEAGRLRRQRVGNLPAPWTLEDFDFDAQPSVDRGLVESWPRCASSPRPPTSC